MYSEITLDHFHHPRCVGELEAPDGHARRENPVCGDVAELWVRVEGGRLREVRFRAFGCAAALASCSMLASTVEGWAVEAARAVQAEELVGWLGGLPASKRHGAALAVETLRRALERVDGGGAASEAVSGT